MTQIGLVQDLTTVNEPDLSLQEEVDIDFARMILKYFYQTNMKKTWS
jgi:hypothetical protein